MSCYCGDASAPEFHRVTSRVARRAHRCCECGDVIEPGETYFETAGKWDREFATFATCDCCQWQRDYLVELGHCVVYGELEEDWNDEWENAEWQRKWHEEHRQGGQTQ